MNHLSVKRVLAAAVFTCGTWIGGVVKTMDLRLVHQEISRLHIHSAGEASGLNHRASCTSSGSTLPQ